MFNLTSIGDGRFAEWKQVSRHFPEFRDHALRIGPRRGAGNARAAEWGVELVRGGWSGHSLELRRGFCIPRVQLLPTLGTFTYRQW